MMTQRVVALAFSTALLISVVAAQPPFGFGTGSGPPWAHGNNWNNTLGCVWWGGSNCGGNGNNGGSNNNNGNSNGNGNSITNQLAAFGLSASDVVPLNRNVTIHAVLACLVWVLLIPTGGILIRLPISSPWLVRGHAILQTLSYALFVVAVGFGVWLVRQLSFSQFTPWSDPHTGLGLAILVVALFQPVLGLVHHSIYKNRVRDVKSGKPSKAPGRTIPGYAHLWIGRFLIVAGMINGGLGLRLAGRSPFAGNQKGKIIGYSVSAAVMFVLYVLFVILGERRRAKMMSQQRQNIDGPGVPLQERTTAPPVYRGPPTYEQSQDDIRKQVQTTARYS